MQPLILRRKPARPAWLLPLLLALIFAGCRDATAPEPRFAMEIRYAANVPPVVREAFDAAKLAWEQAVVGALPPLPGLLHGAWDFCGVPDGEMIHNLLVFLHVRPVDGPGGINAFQSTCLLRDGPVAAPLIAHVTVDVDNIPALVAANRLFDLAIHELGHALGFGWQTFDMKGCLKQPTSFADGRPVPDDTHFACPRAAAAFDAAGGTAYSGGGKVPLENCAVEFDQPCTAGRANSHWRQTVFGDEVMSTYLFPNVPGVLSRVTLAALEDLGHRVNYDAAAAWSVPFDPMQPIGALDLGHDIVEPDRPVPVVDRRGRIVRFVQPPGSD